MTDEIRLAGSDLSSAARARHWVVEVLRGTPHDMVDTIALVVTELVSNVVRHARTDCVLRIDLRRGVARIEVTDDAPGQVVVRAPGPAELAGRGLQIVQSLADEWGVTTDGSSHGKTVWATITWPDARFAEPVRRDRAGAHTETTDPGTLSGPMLIASVAPRAA